MEAAAGAEGNARGFISDIITFLHPSTFSFFASACSEAKSLTFWKPYFLIVSRLTWSLSDMPLENCFPLSDFPLRPCSAFSYDTVQLPLLPPPRRLCFHPCPSMCPLFCLFVSKITEKPHDWFPQNLAEGCGLDQGEVKLNPPIESWGESMFFICIFFNISVDFLWNKSQMLTKNRAY